MRTPRLSRFWTVPILVSFLAFSCGGPSNDRATLQIEADQAYDSLRLFVTEQDYTDIAGREGYTPMEFEQELAQEAVLYQRLLARAKPFAETTADTARARELSELQAHYEVRTKRRTEAFARRNALRQELLQMSPEQNTLRDIPAPGLADRYQAFVEKVAANQSRYTPTDWRLIDRLWESLENRRQQLEPQLSQEARTGIALFRTRFQDLRDGAATANPTTTP